MIFSAFETWSTVVLVMLWSIQFADCSKGVLFSAQNPYCPAEILWSRTLSSQIACATRCRRDTHCNGVVFNADTGQCVGHSDDAPSGTGCEPPDRSIHYEIVCPVGYNMYKPARVCFRIYTDCKTWQDSRSVCQQDGGDLVVLKDPGFLEFFTSAALNTVTDLCHPWDGVFIGATDQVNENQYLWVDGSNTDMSIFEPGEPNDSTIANCIILSQGTNFTGIDFACETPGHYACGIVF